MAIPRRAATAAVVTGPLVWAFRDVAGSGWWAWPGAVLAGLLAAAALAGYVAPPGSGRLLERGCTSCAVVPAASVLGALVVLDGTRTAGGMLTAVGLVGLGLVQRRTVAATTCAVPGRTGRPGA